MCLLLWLTETVPPFVPSLLIWAAVPVLLGSYDQKFGPQSVFAWAADPVMALFFGGFALSVAAQKSGIAARLIDAALKWSGDSYQRFVLLTIFVTAFLSMWMSNIAAAALVFACLAPVLSELKSDDILRRVMLIGVALGADFGGIATPIGTGPNAIAIAAVSAAHPISFLSWMAFALPLTIGALIASYFVLIGRIGPDNAKEWKIADRNPLVRPTLPAGDRKRQSLFPYILAGTILLWLSEPFHKVPAAAVSLFASFALFVSGVLGRRDLLKIDWSTLLLIAGGISLGRLIEQSGVVAELSQRIPFADMHPTVSLFLLCMTSAVLSALMSNTATAVLLIPLAMAVVPTPSTAILIAISASFGVPFIISTPPNALAFGQGGLKFGDLFLPGIVLMVVGCLVISLTGKWVLSLAGIG